MQSDDRAWFQTAVERYERPLVAYALRITRDLGRAREVVQDTFLRLLKAERGQVEQRLSAWLFSVCRNRAIDVLRKESRMRPVPDETLQRTRDPRPGPEQQVELQAVHRHVLDELAGLKDQQQEVIRLKFQQDLSYKEIAEVTGLSVSNVGFLIHTGIQSLRARLVRQGAV